jgi:RimJ/RimL family protein N-acetyltransferase
MPFTLREPALPDAPEIAELHEATWRETYSHSLPEDFFTQEHVRSRHQRWNRALGNPREEWTIRIAENEGQIIGFGFAGPSLGAKGQELPRDRQLWCRSR